GAGCAGRAGGPVGERAPRTPAENASRTLPLLLERGVECAVVVCSRPHLPRARFFFRRLYAARGVATEFRAVGTVPRPAAVVWELAALPLTPWQLRAARAELGRVRP